MKTERQQKMTQAIRFLSEGREAFRYVYHDDIGDRFECIAVVEGAAFRVFQAEHPGMTAALRAIEPVTLADVMAA